MTATRVNVRRLLAGALLSVIALLGIVHGLRAACAQAFYHHVKYGSGRDMPELILARCDAAHALYPFNYYLCIWAGETAYYSRFDAGPEGATRRLEAARRWCDAGLALNPYKSQLRLLKARLLETQSAAEAARYWERYVAWHFWDPYNHAVLAELHARAGDYERALRELKWVEGSGHYASAKRGIEEAWRADMQGAPPPPR